MQSYTDSKDKQGFEIVSILVTATEMLEQNKECACEQQRHRKFRNKDWPKKINIITSVYCLEYRFKWK